MEAEGLVESFDPVLVCKIACSYRRANRDTVKQVCGDLDAAVVTVGVGSFSGVDNVALGASNGDELEEHVLVLDEIAVAVAHDPLVHWNVRDFALWDHVGDVCVCVGVETCGLCLLKNVLEWDVNETDLSQLMEHVILWLPIPSVPEFIRRIYGC